MGSPQARLPLPFMSLVDTQPRLATQGNTFEFPRHMAPKDVKPMGITYKSKASSMATPADPNPPCTPQSTMSVGESQPASDNPYGLVDTLLWRSPLHSTCMLLLGLAMIGLVMFAAYGAHRVTLVSGELLPMGAIAAASAARSTYSSSGTQVSQVLLSPHLCQGPVT
jgi:hypothetical protein